MIHCYRGSEESSVLQVLSAYIEDERNVLSDEEKYIDCDALGGNKC